MKAWLKKETPGKPSRMRLSFSLLRAFLNWCETQDEYRGIADPGEGGIELIMASLIIPYKELSPEALEGVIHEFVTRGGTDYGEREIPLDTKVS